jgi:hypothetical protein
MDDRVSADGEVHHCMHAELYYIAVLQIIKREGIDLIVIATR